MVGEPSCLWLNKLKEKNGGAYSTFWQPMSFRDSTNDGRSSFFTRIITLCTRPTRSAGSGAFSTCHLSVSPQHPCLRGRHSEEKPQIIDFRTTSSAGRDCAVWHTWRKKTKPRRGQQKPKPDTTAYPRSHRPTPRGARDEASFRRGSDLTRVQQCSGHTQAERAPTHSTGNRTAYYTRLVIHVKQEQTHSPALQDGSDTAIRHTVCETASQTSSTPWSKLDLPLRLQRNWSSSVMFML